VTAKRVIWGFRLLFYPCAALVAALMLLHHGGAGAATPSGDMRGFTSQGKAVYARVEDGRIASLVVVLYAGCGVAAPWHTLWIAHPTVRGGRLTARQTFRQTRWWTVRNDFSLDAGQAGRRIDGTVRLTAHVTWPWVGECSSGPVPFWVSQ
jgi:hypothetical protein